MMLLDAAAGLPNADVLAQYGALGFLTSIALFAAIWTQRRAEAAQKRQDEIIAALQKRVDELQEARLDDQKEAKRELLTAVEQTGQYVNKLADIYEKADEYVDKLVHIAADLARAGTQGAGPGR